MAPSLLQSWGYFPKGVTPELRENSPLGTEISVIGHPPWLLCVVPKLSGFALRLTGFESSSKEYHQATLDKLLSVSPPQFSHLFNGIPGGVLRIKYGDTYKNA